MMELNEFMVIKSNSILYVILVAICLTLVLTTTDDYGLLWFGIMMFSPLIGLVIGGVFALTCRKLLKINNKTVLSLTILATVLITVGYWEEALVGGYREGMQHKDYHSRMLAEGFQRIDYDKYSYIYVNEKTKQVEAATRSGTAYLSFADFSEHLYEKLLADGKVEPGLIVSTVVAEDWVYIVGRNTENQNEIWWRLVPGEYGYSLEAINNLHD